MERQRAFSPSSLVLPSVIFFSNKLIICNAYHVPGIKFNDLYALFLDTYTLTLLRRIA